MNIIDCKFESNSIFSNFAMLNRHYKQLLSFLKARLQAFPTLDDSSKVFDKAVSLIGLAIISPSVCKSYKVKHSF